MTQDRKIPDATIYTEKCPLLKALDIIGGKWKIPIIWFLSKNESIRFNELRRQVTGITNIMLTKCLRELESDGLVLRKEFPIIPPHVEYSLTAPAKELLPILHKLYAWGEIYGKDASENNTI